ncbi:MAG: response regulator [Acetobacter sp.]|jgi:signal transduction histidine kinase/ActR/RegA family two-component response regulator|nr:response regulator [Acetobacter sp.]
MARHPARRAQLLALLGAALLIITFGTMAMQLGNEMARHGELDGKSAWSEQYLRQMQRDVSEARICYYAWRSTPVQAQQDCFSSSVKELAKLEKEYPGFAEIQQRLGANRSDSLRQVGDALRQIGGWVQEPATFLQRADTDTVLTGIDNNLATLSRVDNADRVVRLADLLRNTDWQKRLDIIGIIVGVLIMGAAGWILDRASLAAARAEAGSRNLARQLRAVLDSLTIGVVVFGADGRLRHWNDRFAEICGLRGDVLQRGVTYAELTEILAASGMPLLEPFEQIEASLRQGDKALPVSVECRGLNGADLELSRTRFDAPDGTHRGQSGFVITVNDITLRLRSERALGEAQKLRAVGQLTAGIAHDFKNLLTIILGNLELVSDCTALSDADRRQECLDAAAHAARRSEALTGQLLSFVRREAPLSETISVANVFDVMRGLLARVIGSGIHVECRNVENVWPLRVNTAQLESALLNLAINARDAMPEGGTIRIDAANMTFLSEMDLMLLPVEDGRVMRIASDTGCIAAGSWVRLDVIDSGEGMSQEIISSLFEPFFTTKKNGDGTGLGMSMVVNFVHQAGGRVTVVSAPSCGTRVSLWLPRADRPVEVTSTPEPVEVSKAETVLVVEDDPAIRDIVVTILGMSGYRIMEASDGDAALDLLDTGGELPDILVTDIQLPGALDGFRLARILRERHPTAGVVCMSGDFGTDGTPQRPGMPANIETLSKPFRRDSLLSAVKAASRATGDKKERTA